MLRGCRSFCTAGEEEERSALVAGRSPDASFDLCSLTVFVHARLQALLQPAGLALVAVGFVHRTHARPGLAPETHSRDGERKIKPRPTPPAFPACTSHL